MRRLKFTAAGVGMLACAFLGLASPASAQPPLGVGCGATITTDTTLHRDLVDCPNNGILIGADGITLDLNGHRIAGDGAFAQDCPPGMPCDAGIVSLARSRLTVKNGSITDFGVGILLDGGRNNSLRRLSVDRNYFDGLQAVGSAQLTATGNAITRNGVDPHFAGMAMFGLSGALIMNNRLSGNGDQGLFLSDSSNRNRVVGNTFSGDTESGMGVDGNGNNISGNRIAGGGIILAGDDNILRNNYVVDPPVCEDGCGIGISFEDGAGNVIEQNVVVRAPMRGIRIDAYGPAVANNTVRRNIVRDAGVDGIGINLDHVGPVTGTLVEQNFVTGSGDDGIDVESPSTTLRGNVAVHNGDLGVEAVSGVADGGGNQAYANGNPLQCTNIGCGGGRAGR